MSWVKKIFENTNKLNRYLSFVNLFLLVLILCAIGVSLRMNLLDRSLWQDEAMLAFSFTKRNLLNLTHGVFEWSQSAPILYLYIVKLITVVFGNTQFTLRIWSFITFGLTLYCSFYILNNILKVKIPLLGVAFISGLSIMLIYSNEFKPYMTDCFAVLFLLIVFYLYSTQRISRTLLNTIYFIAVWLSNPVCFFIGAFILIEFIEGVSARDSKKIRLALISALISFGSFVIYFFYWLKPVMDSGYMETYWQEQKFPLVPTSLSELERQGILIKHLLSPIRTLKYVVLFSVLMGGFVNLFKYKNRYINSLYLALLIILAASSLGLFPMQDRLFLFIYPLLGIWFFFFIDKLSTNAYSGALLLLFSLVLIFSTNRLWRYKDEKTIFRYNEEFNFGYTYLLNNIKEDDKVYVYNHTIPVFCYKNNFDTFSLGGIENNVILGKSIFSDGMNNEDIEMLVKQESVFILAVHTTPERIDPLLDSLKTHGSLSVVDEHHDTPLYHYFKRP